MNFFHLNCRVVGKARGKSSVAASAYVSAEKIYNERTGITHDYSNKKDVIYSDVVLCENAPAEFKKRSILWNEVEKKEKASDARYARQFDLAIPNEFTIEQAKVLFYDVANVFVKEGMCFDGGIHWEEGNHHFDFLVTTRPFKTDGSWGEKDKKEYAFLLDESGNKIIDKDNPNWWEDKKNPERYGIRIPELDEEGNQKKDKRGGKVWKRERVDSTGWDKKEMVEKWRKDCCDIINKRAVEFGHDINIDHRSYERQNKAKMPTIHEGYMARKMEKDGLISDRCSINREIKKYNFILSKIKKIGMSIKDMLSKKVRDIYGRVDNILQRRRNNKQDGRDGRRDGADAGRDRSLGEREQRKGREDKRTKELCDKAERELERYGEEIQKHR